MSDYIDRQSVLNILLYFNASRQLEMIKKLPSVNAVEIVRCKDCVHFESKDYVMFCKHPDGLDSIKPESFCSYAERKTDE